MSSQNYPQNPELPIETGEWREGYAWELFLAKELPAVAVKSSTAVACVAIEDIGEGTVVLTKNQRGWEILAGHIEAGETLLQALEREALEEGGATVERATLFGYRKITAVSPPPQEDRKSSYPYPVSYIPYFYAFSATPRRKFTGSEIEASGVFSIEGVEHLVSLGHTAPAELIIIKLGLQAARQALQENTK